MPCEVFFSDFSRNSFWDFPEIPLGICSGIASNLSASKDSFCDNSSDFSKGCSLDSFWGIHPEIPGITANISLEILTEISPGIPPEITPRIPSGIVPFIFLEIFTRTSRKISLCILSKIYWESFSRISDEISSGILQRTLFGFLPEFRPTFQQGFCNEFFKDSLSTIPKDSSRNS